MHERMRAMGNDPDNIQREGQLGAIFRVGWKCHRFGNATATGDHDRLHQNHLRTIFGKIAPEINPASLYTLVFITTLESGKCTPEGWLLFGGKVLLDTVWILIDQPVAN